MNVTFDNTRALGVGETVLPSDYWVSAVGPTTREPIDGIVFRQLVPVAQPEVGKIISEDETTEYRRLLSADPYEAMIAELGLETDIAKKFFRVACECCQLFDQKQKAYGMDNVRWLGVYGLNLRIGEKTMRVKNLLEQEWEPTTETVDDSLKDMGIIAIIALMVRRNLWN